MATEDIRISSLANEATEAANGDFLVIDTPDGTKKIQRNNMMPKRGSFPVVEPSEISIASARVWILSSVDGRLREMAVEDLVFGNHRNRRETSNFTLTPGIHNVRAVEVGQALPNFVDTITLDGNVADLAGCDFYMINFRDADVAIQATNITMFVDGVPANGVLRARRAATITVKNDGSQAVLSGG